MISCRAPLLVLMALTICKFEFAQGLNGPGPVVPLQSLGPLNYYLVKEKKTWSEARRYCQTWPPGPPIGLVGDLATFPSYRKWTHIENQVWNLTTPKTWVGGHCPKSDSCENNAGSTSWKWVTGEIIPVRSDGNKQWRPNEPLVLKRYFHTQIFRTGSVSFSALYANQESDRQWFICMRWVLGPLLSAKPTCEIKMVPYKETPGIINIVTHQQVDPRHGGANDTLPTCYNKDPIKGLNRCAGDCGYAETESWTGTHHSNCKCCMPLVTEKIPVILHCTNGKEMRYMVRNPVSCDCLLCKVCENVKLDIQLILDSSGSVGKANWDNLVEILKNDFLPHMASARVALSRFGSTLQIYRTLNQNLSPADLNALTHVPMGLTHTAEAIQNTFLPSYNTEARFNDPSVRKALLVITDGNANGGGDVAAAAQLWKNKGVHVFALGIGSVSLPGLQLISSTYAKKLTSFDALPTEIREFLLPALCNENVTDCHTESVPKDKMKNILKIQKPMSKRPIWCYNSESIPDLKWCTGSCDVKRTDAHTGPNKCRCCEQKETKFLKVLMRCEDGTSFTSGIKNPDSCDCVPCKSKVPPGFVCQEGFNSYCYYLEKTMLLWGAAQDRCEKRGGLLAVVDTPEKNAYVWSLVVAAGGQKSFWWLGGSRIKNIWNWFTKCWGNVPFTWTNWAKGQPDNLSGRQNHLAFYGGQNGKWDDYHQPAYSICEYHRCPCKNKWTIIPPNL